MSQEKEQDKYRYCTDEQCSEEEGCNTHPAAAAAACAAQASFFFFFFFCRWQVHQAASTQMHGWT
jgi:hypothetical protein